MEQNVISNVMVIFTPIFKISNSKQHEVDFPF